MKKRNIILIAVLVIAVIVAAVLIFAKPDAADDAAKAEKTGKQTEERTDVKKAEPLPEPTEQTIIIDKDNKITATLGVEEITDKPEDEQPTQKQDKTDKTDKPEDTPEKKQETSGGDTPEATPAPTDIPIPDDPKTLSYEQFYALSPEQKDEFLHSFGSYDLFYDWLVDAQAKFTKEHPDIEIGPGGSIDLSQLQK